MIPLLLLVSAGAAMAWRRARRRSAARRSARIDAGLAPVIDLIVVVVGSGATIHQALVTVAAHGPLPVRPVFGQVLEYSAAGMLLPDALAMVSDRLTPDFHPLIGALAAAERDGGSLSAFLNRLTDDADQARRWQIEAQAKRLPVRLLVPLVLCLLPAVVIGALVPLVVVTLRQLGP